MDNHSRKISAILASGVLIVLIGCARKNASTTLQAESSTAGQSQTLARFSPSITAQSCGPVEELIENACRIHSGMRGARIAATVDSKGSILLSGNAMNIRQKKLAFKIARKVAGSWEWHDAIEVWNTQQQSQNVQRQTTS